MNKRQDSTNSMLQVVRDFLLRNTAITSKLPNFTQFFTALLNSIVLIQKCAENQMLNRSGLNSNKKMLRTKLVEMAADVSRKIQAYASFIDNLILAGETKYTETQLKKSTDIMLCEKSMILYDRVQDYLNEVETYELTEASQTIFLKTINDFKASIPKPRLGTTDRMKNTQELKNAFTEANENLDHIDTLVEIVRLIEPSFYHGYKSARKLRNKRKCVAIKGLITDTSGLPVKGVTVMIYNSNSTTPVVIKTTAPKGGFIIKTLPPGMYDVIVKKFGYMEKTVSIAISQGEMTYLKVELEKML